MGFIYDYILNFGQTRRKRNLNLDLYLSLFITGNHVWPLKSVPQLIRRDGPAMSHLLLHQWTADCIEY